VQANGVEEGTTAPEMMLFPYIKEPATGSRMPSMSTGGAAMKAMMKQVVAVSRVGIINTPNQPTYRRLSVLVTHEQKRSHWEALCSLCRVVVIGL
jgi:hypothetical protein